MVKTPPFHGDNMGSNPVGVIKNPYTTVCGFFVFYLIKTLALHKLSLGCDKMCTAVFTKTQFGSYFGRNLDFEHSFGEKICITPRNHGFNFTCGLCVSQNYAIIGMALLSCDYPLYFDATNEYGLSIAGLNFPLCSHYNPNIEGKLNIASYELIPYILSQYKTVDELKEFIYNINITNASFNDKFPPTPLHWLIADKEKSVTLEQTKNGLKVYDNPCGVLTNSPEFNIQLFNLNNYIGISPNEPENTFSKKLDLKTYSKGMGALGLPGDYSSVSRFVRAAFVNLNISHSDDEYGRINEFFHILNSVYQHRGCIKTHAGFEHTRYSSCCDLNSGIYYYTAYNNSNINGVDMYKENLDSSKLIIHDLKYKMNINIQN